MLGGSQIDDEFRGLPLRMHALLSARRPAKAGRRRLTKSETVINLKTVKTLGLTVPLIMQMTADEVIE